MWYLTHDRELVDLAKMHRIRVSSTEDGRYFVCGIACGEETSLTAPHTLEEAEGELTRIAHSLSVVNAYVPREDRFASGRKDA